jgi:hypothetical protein
MRWRKTIPVSESEAAALLVDYVPCGLPVRLFNMKHAIRVTCPTEHELPSPWKYGWRDRTGVYNKPIWIQDCLPNVPEVVPGLRVGQILKWRAFIVNGQKCTKTEAIAFCESKGIQLPLLMRGEYEPVRT